MAAQARYDGAAGGEVSERAPALLDQILVGDEPRAVPPVQDRRVDVVGVRQVEAAVEFQRVPVVGPLGRNRLQLDESRSVPLVDHRRPGFLARVGQPHPLREREEVTVLDREMGPLLGRERGKPLEGLEAVAVPLVDDRADRVAVGSRARANARDRQERAAADGEELRVLAARRLQRAGRLPARAVEAEQQQVGVAVAAVHPRRGPRRIVGELRDRQVGAVVEP